MTGWNWEAFWTAAGVVVLFVLTIGGWVRSWFVEMMKQIHKEMTDCRNDILATSKTLEVHMVEDREVKNDVMELKQKFDTLQQTMHKIELSSNDTHTMLSVLMVNKGLLPTMPPEIHP